MATNFGFPPVTAGEFYFVSYNTQDSARVGEIAREMNNRGIPLWYDEGLLVGEKWERQIARQIEDCRAVILFVTKKLMAKENPYVQIEYDMAIGYGKKIYVILLDNVTFSDVTTDLKGWWLRLNKLHGVPVSGKFFANDIVDIMDRHIHFIRNVPVVEEKAAPALVQEIKPTVKRLEETEEEPVIIPFLGLEEEESEPAGRQRQAFLTKPTATVVKAKAVQNKAVFVETDKGKFDIVDDSKHANKGINNSAYTFCCAFNIYINYNDTTNRYTTNRYKVI